MINLLHILASLSFSIGGMDSTADSIQVPSQKSLPRGFAIDKAWLKNCREFRLPSVYDIDEDGIGDTLYLKHSKISPASRNHWKRTDWVQAAIRLSRTGRFVLIPAWINSEDVSSGLVVTCGDGPTLKLVKDSCVQKGRFSFEHGIPGAIERRSPESFYFAFDDSSYYYPLLPWMERFSKARLSSAWVTEGRHPDSITASDRITIMQWDRLYMFSVNGSGIAIFAMTDHVHACSEKAK